MSNIFDSLIPNITPKDTFASFKGTEDSINFSSIHEANTRSPTRVPRYMPSQGTSDIGEAIARVESGGDYTASNPHSSAVGKYQFLWKSFKPDIERVTGITSKEEFKNNPDAQESFFNWYKDTKMMPGVQKLKQYNTKGLNDLELAKLYHFKGGAGALKWLTKGVDDTHANNMSIEGYMKHYGGGGEVEDPMSKFSPKKQYVWNTPNNNIPNPQQDNYTPSKGVEYLKKALAVGSISTANIPSLSYLFDVAGATGDAYTSFRHMQAGDNDQAKVDALESTIGFLPLPKAFKDIKGYKYTKLGKVVKAAKDVTDGTNVLGYGGGGKVKQADVNDPSMDAISKVLMWRNRDKNFVNRVFHGGPEVQTNTLPGYENEPNTEHSTHLMSYDPNSKRVYPELVQQADNKLHYLEGDEAWNYADKTSEYIQAPTSAVAKYLSNRGYKNASNQMFGTKFGGGGGVGGVKVQPQDIKPSTSGSTAINTPVKPEEYPENMIAPPVVVTGFKNKDTREFYDGLKKQNMAEYQALIDMGRKYGFTNIKHTNVPNAMYSAKTLPNLISNGVDTVINDAYQKTKYKDATGKPITDKIQFDKNIVLTEMGHKLQYNSLGSTGYYAKYGMKDALGTAKAWLSRVFNGDDSVSSTYSEPGSMEYEAHKVYEPMLRKEFRSLVKNYNK